MLGQCAHGLSYKIHASKVEGLHFTCVRGWCKVKIVEMLTTFIFATKWTQGVRATKHSLHLAKNKDYVMRTHIWTMMNMGNNNTKEYEHIQKVDIVGVIHNASVDMLRNGD